MILCYQSNYFLKQEAKGLQNPSKKAGSGLIPQSVHSEY